MWYERSARTDFRSMYGISRKARDTLRTLFALFSQPSIQSILNYRQNYAIKHH